MFVLLESVDAVRWPLTAEFLYTYEHEQRALQRLAPTAAWVYGSVMDRNETLRMALFTTRASTGAA